MNIYDEPRCPKDAYVQGHRVREMSREELRAAGYSEAETASMYRGQFHTHRSPLVHPIEMVIAAKASSGEPMLPHEQAWVDDPARPRKGVFR